VFFVKDEKIFLFRPVLENYFLKIVDFTHQVV